MKLGKLFSAITQTVSLPIDMATDILTLNEDKKTQKKIKSIEEKLDSFSE